MKNTLSLPASRSIRFGLLLLSAGSSACVSPDASPSANLPPLQPITREVNLEKFMGDWYVIAHIPTFIETQAYNAVENYALSPDGTIATTFTFNQGGFDGPLKTYRPRGFVYNRETNAEWRMQFVWPFKAPFLISDLSPDYQTTIIGVPNRRYVWIMARTKTLPDQQYAGMVKWLENSGHDISKLRKVPQR
jgi:apolipoprotein D and lipocalin family protein